MSRARRARSRSSPGGAQGIGRAIAEGLAAEGARIVIADLEGAEEAAAGLSRTASA